MFEQQPQSQNEKSPFRTVELKGGHQILVVHASYFDHHATKRVEGLSSQYYEFALFKAESRCIVLIKGRAPQVPGKIDREEAARRRLELAAGLFGMFEDHAVLDPGEINYNLLFTLLTTLSQETVSGGTIQVPFFGHKRHRFAEEITGQQNGTVGATASTINPTSGNTRHDLRHTTRPLEKRPVVRPVFSEVLQARSSVMKLRRAKIKMQQP